MAADGRPVVDLPREFQAEVEGLPDERPEQTETRLRKKYIEWVLETELPGGIPVSSRIPAIRTRALRLKLQRCAEQGGEFRHPKKKERRLVSAMKISNTCAASALAHALEGTGYDVMIEGKPFRSGVGQPAQASPLDINKELNK